MGLTRHEKNKSLASRCRNYVDYQNKTETPDGEGGSTEVWENIANATQIPTEILPISAERRAEMRSWNVIATHYLKVRSNIPVEEIGRAVFVDVSGTRYFYIKTLEDLQTRHIEQFMIVEERRD